MIIQVVLFWLGWWWVDPFEGLGDRCHYYSKLSIFYLYINQLRSYIICIFESNIKTHTSFVCYTKTKKERRKKKNSKKNQWRKHTKNDRTEFSLFKTSSPHRHLVQIIITTTFLMNPTNINKKLLVYIFECRVLDLRQGFWRRLNDLSRFVLLH